MKVLSIGGAMIDTIAIIDSNRIERMTMRNADSSFLLLEEGCKTEAEEVSTHCGGGAINAAVAMARLGLDVAALGKLGRDIRAETILARLTQERVSTRWMLRDGRAPTGASVLVSSHDRNAAIFTFRGANTLLESEDLRDDAFAVDFVYVAGLSNQSADRFPEIIKRAKAQGAIVATNPGVRQLSTRGRVFFDCLPLIDIVTINRDEANVLVPSLVARSTEGGPTLTLVAGEEPPPLAVRGLAGGGFEMGVAGFLRVLTELGPQHLVVTDGGGGAFVGLRDRILFCPVLKTNVAGTAGAGDAFSSTFAAYVALGRSAEDAVRAAALNAASVVGYVDTQTGLLSRDVLDARLRELANRLDVRTWGYDGSRRGAGP
jgi:ribokinase